MLRILASATTVALLILISPSISFADSPDCSLAATRTTGCSVSANNDGTQVTLDAALGGADAGAGAAASGGSDSGSVGSSGGGDSAATDSGLPAVFRDGYTVTAPVTLADIARFRPDSGTDLMEPNGWMIVGLSTNFYAHATQHVKAGTLLGGPASVRFTPVRYSWDYGDGATRTSSTPGATWSAQGITEFDATPTSHIYRASGRYVINLTIGYAPEYRLGSSTVWIPVRGLVWAPANPLEAIAAGGAKTVLVEDECTINPSGPGC